MAEEPFPFYPQPWYRRSPFHEAARRHGCRSWGVYNHMLLPTLYDDPVEEYRALVEGVVVWDVAAERIVELRGPDAFRLANLLTCRDLTRCPPGQGRYAPLLASDGGIVNDPVLLRLEEDRIWLALADSDAGLYVRGVAAGLGLAVEVEEPEVYSLQVQGPRSREVVAALCGEGAAGLRYYHCAPAVARGIPVVVSRTGWTGEVGYELYLLDPARGEELFEAVLSAGRAFGIRPAAPSEARRIEAGIVNYGSDISVRDTPLHVSGMERLVEEQEGDYLGRAALERLRREGVDRKLVGVTLGGEPLAAEGALAEVRPVLVEGRPAGRLTAAAWSPRLQRNVGYAWVPIAHASPGTPIEVDLPGGRVEATVARLPFVDPDKRIPRG